MPQVCQKFKKAQVKILDYTALQAEAVADQVHAPNPDKARSDAFQRISETAKKGHYNAYITVRGVDLRQLCLDLLNRGFDIESYGTPDRDDCYSVNVTWGNASSRHITHRLQIYAKDYYFAHNTWPKALCLRQDEYDLALFYYKEAQVTERILGVDVTMSLHVEHSGDNSLYNS